MNAIDTLKLAGLVLLTLALGACGQSEAPAPAPEPTTVTDETAPESDAAEETMEAETEIQSVVEESAAEPEAEEQAIVLAQADTKPQQQKFKYKEGTHFTRFVPTQPTMGSPDEVEVAEFFWFGCPHCFDLEPFMARFEENLPTGVRVVRVPVTWNRAAFIRWTHCLFPMQKGRRSSC